MEYILWGILAVGELCRYYLAYYVLEKVEFKRLYIGVIFISAFLTGIYFLQPRIREGRMVLYLVLYLIILLTVQINRRNVISIIMLSFIQSCLHSICHYLILYVRPLLGKKHNGPLFVELLEGGMSLLLLLILIVFVLLYQNNGKGEIKLSPWGIFTVTIMTTALFLSLAMESLEHMQHDRKTCKMSQFAPIIGALAYLSITIIILMVFYMKKMNLTLNRLLQSEANIRTMQKSYFELMQDKKQEIVRYRHDFSNHMVHLQRIAREEKSERIKEYIDAMQLKMEAVQTTDVKTGDSTLDLVVNYFLPQLDKDVSTSMSGIILMPLAVSEYDICTIFSNLFQNIVEEMRRITNQKKVVAIAITQGNDYVQLRLQNSTHCEQMDFKQQLPVTVKKNAEDHGLGLKNVKQTVERYQGIFKASFEQQMFTVDVILPVK